MSKSSEDVTAIHKREMINALEVNLGNVTAATKEVGITPRTHYRWLKEDEEYADATENMKDICYRRLKEGLIDMALKKIEKGNTAVLMKMLGIYLKKLPDDMERVSRINNVPLIRPRIKYVHTREEADEITKREGPM